MIIKAGTKWIGNDYRTVFYVKAVVEIDGHTWVHYGERDTGKEYSCYQESFEERFKQITE